MTGKQVTSLQVLAIELLAGLCFDKISGKHILNKTYYLPKRILNGIVNEVTSDFENVLKVRGGNKLYFALDPQESDYGSKPYDYQTLVLENKSKNKLWFQIRPFFVADESFNCVTYFVPVRTIGPNECISHDVCLDISMPLTLRRRTIRQGIETTGELLIYVWECNPFEKCAMFQRRGIIRIRCCLSLGRYLPLNFELEMRVSNINSIQQDQNLKFYEKKDHVKQYFL